MTTEERLEKIERDLAETKRRNRWILGSATALILGSLFLAAMSGNNRTIRANEFILIDKNGKTHAQLTRMKDGPGLFLYGENGKKRVGLAVMQNMSVLFLRDENGKDRACLFNLTEDGSGMVLHDATGKLRTAVGTIVTQDPDGKAITHPESTLTLFGSDGTVAWQAPPGNIGHRLITRHEPVAP
jgi:hypothetical protein